MRPPSRLVGASFAAVLLGLLACLPPRDGSDPPSPPSPLAPSASAPPALDAPATAAPVASVASLPATPTTPLASASAPPAPTGPCPADMVLSARTCVDRYEAPNQAGEKPLVMVTAPEAESWCSEHGKRLCTEDEWIRGCGGPKGQSFPYGTSYKEGVCNDDGVWKNPSWSKLATWPSEQAQAEVTRLDQRAASGERAGCVSPEGAHDMTGNVAEWVRRTRPHEPSHPHVSMGCYWGKCFRPPHTPVCDYANYNHPSGWRSYEIGFRCCRDARR